MAKFTAADKATILEALRRMNEILEQLRIAIAADEDGEVRRLVEAIVDTKRNAVIQTIPDIPIEEGDPLPFWLIYEMWYDLDSYLLFLHDNFWPFSEPFWGDIDKLQMLRLWFAKFAEEVRNLGESFKFKPECGKRLAELRRNLYILRWFLNRRRSHLRLMGVGRTYIVDVINEIIENKFMFLECVDPAFKYLDCYKMLKTIDDSLVWAGKRRDHADEAARALERAEQAKRELEETIENTPTTGN